MKELFKKILYILFRIKFYQAIGYIYEREPYRVTLFAICPYSLKMQFTSQECTEDEEDIIDSRIDEYTPSERYLIVYVDRDYDTDYTYTQVMNYVGAVRD